MIQTCRSIGMTLAVLAAPAFAQDVRITEDMPEVSIRLNGQVVTIGRVQDQDNRLTGDFTRTSRACPPFCIHPMSAAPGVETLGELEVIAFLQDRVANGTGLLIDSRLPDFHAMGTIPGAVNVPFATLEASNPYRNDILRALGAVDLGDRLDFTNALDLVLFCNGPWCDQSPRAIRNLLAAGYPAERIGYYRGGMQAWLSVGLTVTTPTTDG